MPASQRGRDKVEKLRRALFRRNWEKAETVIRQIPEGRLLPSLYVDQEQWSVLHVAAMVNAPASLLQRILDVVDVNFCMQMDTNGNNPLHRLCKTGTDIDTVRLLALARPQAFHEMNTEDNRTPFDVLLAQERFSPDEIALLITDVANAWPDGMHTTNTIEENILHRAVPYCSRHGVEVARAILDAAPGLMERTDENGATPIHHTVRQKGTFTTPLARLLVNQDGDCALDLGDFSGRTPLHEACSTGTTKRDVIEILVAKYPDALELADESGMTPLAVFRRRYRRHSAHYVDRKVVIAEAAMTLISGAPTRCIDSPSLHQLLRNKHCTLDILRFLVTALSDQASAMDDNGDLPLHFVCSMPDADDVYYCDVVEPLLKAFPASCKIPNHDNYLPLELMARSGKTWNNGMRLIFLEHPAAVADLGLNSLALCTLLEELGRKRSSSENDGKQPAPDSMFRLLTGAPDLLNMS